MNMLYEVYESKYKEDRDYWVKYVEDSYQEYFDYKNNFIEENKDIKDKLLKLEEVIDLMNTMATIREYYKFLDEENGIKSE